MSWQNVAPGRYERECDTNEQFFKLLADSTTQLNGEHWIVNTIASIKVVGEADIEAALSQAWLHTRYQAPLLACLLRDNRLSYQCPSSAEQQAEWLRESFFVEAADKTVEKFLLQAENHEYTSLHFFPRSSEIVLRIHHWLVDGIGALNTLDILLGYLANLPASGPKFGDEWTRLQPSNAEAAGFSRNKTKEADEYAQKMFMSLVGNLPSAGLPVKSPSKDFPMRCTRLAKISIEPQLQNALVQTCRRHGLTLGQAMQAAVIHTTQANASPATKGRPYTALVSVNNRPYLDAPYNDVKAWPMGAYLIGLPTTVYEGDFLDQAREVQKVYRQSFRQEDTPFRDAYEGFNRMLQAAFSQPPPPETPPMTTPQLHNLGQIEDRFVKATYSGTREVSLETVEVTVDQMAPELIMYQWTFRGTLHLSAGFNEAFYDKDFVQQFLNQTRDTLLDGLGIKRGAE